MKHRLSCSRTDIEYGPVSLLDVSLARNLRRRQMAAANHLGILRLASFNPAKCFFGITSTCVGALGSMSSKANTCSSSINFLRRNFAAKNAAEKAIVRSVASCSGTSAEDEHSV